MKSLESDGSPEPVSKRLLWNGLSALIPYDALVLELRWYIIAPSALKPIEIMIYERQGRALYQPGAKPQDSSLSLLS
jgi:hypothetical protein